VLAVSVLGSGIAGLDATVVSIALPTIGRDVRTGVAALQWVMNGYTLTLAAFLLIGGSLGDRFGRRKVYLIETVWFALASAACGLAPDVVFLSITRILQGAGAALLTPGSLAILQASFRPADRARAIGAWSGLGGIAATAGPLVGGYLRARLVLTRGTNDGVARCDRAGRLPDLGAPCGIADAAPVDLRPAAVRLG
jgi:MFS family permease